MQPISPRLQAAGARAAGARFAGALWLALALSAAACSDEPSAVAAADAGNGAVAATLAIVSGNNQSAAPGTDLPQPLVVRVLNSAGTPIANQVVTFVVTAGGGSVFGGTTKTDGTGYAREWWTLGPAAGTNRVEARAVNASTGSKQVFGTFAATATTTAGGTDTTSTAGGGGTPAPAPVATVTVSPNPASVQAGSTVQLSATTRDAGGATLTGRTVGWASSNTAVATVSATGLVSGVSAGSATITATSEGKSGTSAVTVTAPTTPPPPPPPPSGNTAFTNEPAGLTAITTNAWDALGTGGWQHANRDSRSQITADATAPLSPSNVLEMLYPAGYTGGGEPAIEEFDFRTPPTEVFVGAWVKFSPNWQGHTSGINKIMNVMTNAGFGRTWIVLRAVGEKDTNNNLTDGPFFVDVAYCAQYGGYPGANKNQDPVSTGQWHKIEWQIKTGAGGLVRWWVDGVLRGEYTNLSCMGSQLQWVEIAPTFGGIGDTKQQNDYIRYDHVYISGR